MKHILQSPQWGEVKTKIGTPAIRLKSNGVEIQYTKHKIPFINFYYGYAPRVDNFSLDWKSLRNSLNENSCVAVNFDVPNIVKNTTQAAEAAKILEKNCVLAPKDTFANANMLLDISPPEEEILAKMHKKHRYNIRYSKRKGIKVRKGTNREDFETFYTLLKDTAERQKYYIHSKDYYQTIWDVLKKDDMAHILIAEYEGVPLTAWMLFTYEGVLYYPYGGSSDEKKNLQHSLATAWSAIKLGKENGCNTFDMWGTAENLDDKEDEWHGFTDFKRKFNGEHVRYIDSYDFVVNEPMYKLFNTANDIRWKILKLIK